MARTYTDTPEPRFVERALNADNISVAGLFGKLEGDDVIIIDYNEGGTKVALKIDSAYYPYAVELEGTSGSLSDADYAKLTISQNATIIIGDNYYKKSSESGTALVYQNINVAGTTCTLGEVIIDLDAESATYKGWQLSTHTLTMG